MNHGKFLEHIATVTGESLGTVKLAFRVLREAGLITGGRGTNAPTRTVQDAALFFCWIGLSDRPGEAAQMVNDFGFARARCHSNPLGVQDGEILVDVLANLLVAEAAGKDFGVPYSVDFEPDSLSVRLAFGFSGILFDLADQHREDGQAFEDIYRKPYRVTRTFVGEFVRALAAPFREGAGNG